MTIKMRCESCGKMIDWTKTVRDIKRVNKETEEYEYHIYCDKCFAKIMNIED